MFCDEIKRVTKDDAEVTISYDVASLYTKVPRQQARKVTHQRLDGHTHRGRVNNSYPTKVNRQYRIQSNVSSVNSLRSEKNQKRSEDILTGEPFEYIV